MLCVLVLSACGMSDDPPSAPPSPSSTVPATSETAADVLTLRGRVSHGIEPGCLLLTDGGQTYLLLGARERLPESGEVTVRGRPRPEMATTCQQGVPLLVLDVLDASTAPPTPEGTR
ncbi:hypothetical protein SAMN05216174_101225 [Actinokineospora iranica]|uniref:Uncharacterized protein n=2 Tax=Actinokineospora iranica TaxID=1271860 RepID=A0A1G6J3M2_9PSEU|nr:hypothetical protein SAMN05216174_101225 [Actinokineospora iranica]